MALEAVLAGEQIASMNFVPDSGSLTVRQVVDISRSNWPSVTSVEFSSGEQSEGMAAVALQLDSGKARASLNWSCAWSQSKSVSATIKWWDKGVNESVELVLACNADIDLLLTNARSLGIS